MVPLQANNQNYIRQLAQENDAEDSRTNPNLEVANWLRIAWSWNNAGLQEMQDTFLASLSDLLRVHGHKRSKLLSAWHNDSHTSGTNLYKWYVCLNLPAQSRKQTIGQAKSHVLFHEVPLQMDPFPFGASKKSASLQVLGPLSSLTLHHCDVIHVCGPTCSEICYQNYYFKLPICLSNNSSNCSRLVQSNVYANVFPFHILTNWFNDLKWPQSYY